jgi:hypothetical protein
MRAASTGNTVASSWFVFSLRVRLSKDSWAAKTSLTCWPTGMVGWSEEEGS